MQKNFPRGNCARHRVLRRTNAHACALPTTRTQPDRVPIDTQKILISSTFFRIDDFYARRARASVSRVCCAMTVRVRACE
jgi:hypothetical protein